MAKADLKNLEAAWKLALGRAIARCFKLANVTQKEGAGRIERDQAQVARWIAGTEPPQLAAIFAHEEFRGPLVQALAEMAGADVVVTVKLRVSA